MLVLTHAIISPMNLLEKLDHFIKNKCPNLWNKGIVVGVSGGPDSIALLHLLSRYDELQSKIIVAHLDHHLRSSSTKDAQFVKNYGESLGFQVQIHNENIEKIASKHTLSIEDAGRQTRYKFFNRLAVQNKIQIILVAHTANDQLETILMNLIRGAGITGLSGMKSVTRISNNMIKISSLKHYNTLVGRPLLTSTRKEIIDYCNKYNLDTIKDPSNNDRSHTRNIIRHDVIPILQKINPKVVRTTTKMSQTLRYDNEILIEAYNNAWNDLVISINKESIFIDRSKFTKYALGVQLAILRLSIKHLKPHITDIGFDTIINAVNFSQSADVRQECSLPDNLVMHIDYKQIIIKNANSKIITKLPYPFIPIGTTKIMKVPSTTKLIDCDWNILLDYPTTIDHVGVYTNDNRWTAYIDVSTIKQPEIQIRTRKKGDSFQPLGMNGKSQLISDYMTNTKIPHELRDHIPLFVIHNKIIWIPGWRTDHRYRIQANTKTILRIKMTQN